MAVDNTHFKGSWRPEEDAALREAVARHGEKNWSTVARTFNQLMGRPPLLGRAPKQCRSRYLQQLVPGIKTGEWTVQEEEILVEGHKQFGNQWTLIASMLPGRTETSVKNHYNCTARRKVPSDPSRMTILQHYLAAIGVITPPGSKSGASKYPSLGSGYPNSGGSSGMYFQTASAAAAAAAVAAVAKAANRNRRGTSAPAHSPSGSHMGYEEYDSSNLAHAYSEADFNQAYAAYQAYQEQQHHMAAAAAAAAAMQQGTDEGGEDDEGDQEEEVAEAAADGLLQLAQAALMHIDSGEAEEDHDDDGAEGSGSGEAQHGLKQRDTDMEQAPVEASDDNTEQQQQHEAAAKAVAAAKQAQLAAAAAAAAAVVASKAGSKSPGGRPLPAWLKPELALSVLSSEESDRTAEEPDEGSPLAEQLLRQHLKAKRGSPGSAAAVRALQPAAAAKRPRTIWEGVEATDAAATAAAAAQAAAAPTGSRFSRPVLDVSEPEGDSSSVPPPLSLPVEPASPAVLSVASNTAPLSDLNAHLVALLMGAFMGASDAANAAQSSAAALPSEALATLARVMATSMQAMAGQQQQQQAAPAAAAQPTTPLQAPAAQLAAPGDA